jgi:hypothetical protein
MTNILDLQKLKVETVNESTRGDWSTISSNCHNGGGCSN